MVIRAWRDGTNGVWGWTWVEAKKKKMMKTIFRMNGYFRERAREGKRKWNRKGETRETARERSAT